MRRFAVLLVLVAALPRAAADPFVDVVRQVALGPLGGGGSETAVLGPPVGGGAFQGGNDTLSLGLGGSIVVEFADNVVVDGPGPDLTVFENAFLIRGLTTLPPFAEPGIVSVSADGVTYRAFPCALDEAPYHAGCAGVYPVFATDAAGALVPSEAPIEALIGLPVDDFVAPSGSGGDSFDLADVGLAAVRFVRVQGGSRRPGLEGLGGFDLDAVAGIHSIETAGSADRDADGIPDPADDCPDVFDPVQSDLDGDGIGDACSDDPPPADADADGLPDSLDNCPATPNAGQDDGDADGVGDACDRCVGRPDPPGDEPCPASVADADFDGAPDDVDPCPEDPACTPLEMPTYAGSGRRREGEDLLQYVLPGERLVRVSAETTRLDLVVVIAADVEPGSVRVRVGRRDLTDVVGPFVPGSTRTISLPVERRRTRVRLSARRRDERGRRAKDRDKFAIVKERTKDRR
jgi:hypothetical protein